jgi:hypothetical protein
VERAAYVYGLDDQHLVVPMMGADNLIKHFQAYQRSLNPRDLSAFVHELELLGQEPGDLPFVFYMDLEAPLVGSHHGLAIWENIFEAIDKAVLGDLFLDAAAACALWRQQAQKPGTGEPFSVYRELGSKWQATRPQFEFRHRILRSRLPETEAEHRVASLFTQSDYYVAIDNQLRRDIVLSADKGDLRIGYDPAVIQVSELALQAWEAGRDVAEALRYKSQDETAWYRRALAAAIQRNL